MTFHPLVAKSEKMPATGGNKLGGLPLAGHLGLPALLVREAVQNSWDARDDRRGEAPVRFQIDGWDLDTDALDRLRSLLPVNELDGFQRTDEAPDLRGILHPASALSRQSVRILVISDRNTVGLCGPSRSGTQWSPIRHGESLGRGQQRFANFVRNVGRAAADIGDGDGGAYGLGKGALWMASECGTVLVHTRTTDEHGEPVERWIGTVHGEHFYSGGEEFTGRHFIGIESDGGVLEPLIGDAAAQAARLLPLPAYSFGDRPVDGTSIVIVAPRLSLDWRTEMNRLRDAVRWHSWPKRVPGVRGPEVGADIDVRMTWNNHVVEVPEPLEDPEIRPYAKALLDCARDRNSEEEHRDVVAECHRPRKILGLAKFRSGGTSDQNVFHITLTHQELIDAPRATALGATDDEPAVDFDAPWGQMALIRREPLLLVRYEPIGGPDEAATEVGVFLSAEDSEVEEALTRAEPPAHDDWIHKIVPKDNPRDHRRTLAKRTLEEIKRSKQVLLAGYRRSGAGERGGGEQEVSRKISQGLFGGLGGKVAPRPPGAAPASARRQPHALLAPARSYRSGDQTVHELDLTLLGLGSASRTVTLISGASAVDNAGSMSVGEHLSYTWFNADGTKLADGTTIEVEASDQTRLTLILRVSGDLRLRPKVDVRAADGA